MSTTIILWVDFCSDWKMFWDLWNTLNSNFEGKSRKLQMNVASWLLRVERTNESSEEPVHASLTLYEHTQVWIHQFPSSRVINHHSRTKPLNIENFETQNLKILFQFWVCRGFLEVTKAQKSVEKKFRGGYDRPHWIWRFDNSHIHSCMHRFLFMFVLQNGGNPTTTRTKWKF